MSLITTNLNPIIRKYFTEETQKVSISNKTRYEIINDISSEMGWGRISLLSEIFSYVASLLGYTYQSTQEVVINKALREYKIDTYGALILGIQGIVGTQQLEAQEIAAIAHAQFPQFSIQEILYILKNVETCNDIIKRVSDKNEAWKQISTPMHAQGAIESFKFRDFDALAKFNLKDSKIRLLYGSYVFLNRQASYLAG